VLAHVMLENLVCDCAEFMVFRSASVEKLHLEQDYPCPCRCEGRLTGLALTELMGCFQCGRLFLLVEDGFAIAKPAAHPWTRWQWQWTGENWYRSSREWLFSPVGLSILVIGGALVGGLVSASLPFPGIQLFLGLLGGVSSLLLLLILVVLFSFRA